MTNERGGAVAVRMTRVLLHSARLDRPASSFVHSLIRHSLRGSSCALLTIASHSGKSQGISGIVLPDLDVFGQTPVQFGPALVHRAEVFPTASQSLQVDRGMHAAVARLRNARKQAAFFRRAVRSHEPAGKAGVLAIPSWSLRRRTRRRLRRTSRYPSSIMPSRPLIHRMISATVERRAAPGLGEGPVVACRIPAGPKSRSTPGLVARHTAGPCIVALLCGGQKLRRTTGALGRGLTSAPAAPLRVRPPTPWCPSIVHLLHQSGDRIHLVLQPARRLLHARCSTVNQMSQHVFGKDDQVRPISGFVERPASVGSQFADWLRVLSWTA